MIHFQRPDTICFYLPFFRRLTILAFTFILIFSAALSAQEEEKPFRKPPTKAIKLSPFELFTSTPSIPIGYEFAIGKRVNLELSTGLVFNLFDTGSGNDFPFWGAKNRVELRLYRNKELRNPTYFSWDIMHKFYFQNRNEWVCRQDCAYEENIEYQRFHSALAGHLKWGLLKFFNEVNYFDFQIGAGVRWRHRKRKNYPDDVVQFEDTFNIFEIPHGDYIFPSVMFRMLFGFGL